MCQWCSLCWYIYCLLSRPLFLFSAILLLLHNNGENRAFYVKMPHNSKNYCTNIRFIEKYCISLQCKQLRWVLISNNSHGHTNYNSSQNLINLTNRRTRNLWRRSSSFFCGLSNRFFLSDPVVKCINICSKTEKWLFSCYGESYEICG